MAKVRRLRDGDLAYEPVEKPDVRYVRCHYCNQLELKKKAVRRKKKWICRDCNG
jgi:formylmethanofuran dehydrogenase subunit E